ncbi:MAG TPA: SIMPL domain-containing protein [Isosphaeraceae bacterium]
MIRMQGGIMRIAAACAAMCAPAAAQDQLARVRPDGMRTISVQGTATVSVAPDMAAITVGAETQGPTAVEAMAANNKAMAALMDLLKRHGIAGRDVQTSDLSLSPAYDRPVPSRAEDEPDKAPPRIIGYKIRNTIRITVRDVARVGDLLDATVRAGVNKIEHLSFQIADPKATLRDLRRKALAEARAKAEDVATEAGMALGAPVSIEVDYSAPQYSFMARSIASEKYETTVPIAPGMEELTSAVGVVYELKPR